MRNLLLGLALLASSVPVPAQVAANPFFVFDNGLHARDLTDIPSKLDLVKRVGFDGLSWRLDDSENFTAAPSDPAPPADPNPAAHLKLLLEGAGQRGLKVFVLYVGLEIKGGRLVYDPQLKQAIALCKGTGTMIWPYIFSSQFAPSSPAGDAIAVPGLRELADLAADSGVRIALYPHYGLWLQRVDDAVRVIRQVDRPNLGLTFNLCHALLDGEDARIGEVIAAAAPYLFVATINGADAGVAPGDMKRAIRTLDRGSFDVGAVVRKLQAVGFRGPIGLQCYQVPGDPHEFLPRSFAAWKRMSAASP
jgi:sugar phosphate isomerase/epimerase